MYHAMVAARVLTEAAVEAERELPMSPLAFGVLAAVFFTTLLAITFAFRSIGHRHSPQAYAHPTRRTDAARATHATNTYGETH